MFKVMICDPEIISNNFIEGAPVVNNVYHGTDSTAILDQRYRISRSISKKFLRIK